MRNPIYLVTILILIQSCTPKIDSSSEKSYNESLEKVTNSVDKETKELLLNSIETITTYQLSQGNKNIFDVDFDKLVDDVRKQLDGLDASEIINLGKEIQTKIDIAERKAAKMEYDSLILNKLKAKSFRDSLKDFEILSSRFYRVKRYITTEPVIDITIKNNSDQAISSISFLGEYKSPERSVPWAKAEFSYEISGGLEPGEDQRWRLQPNSLHDFYDLQSRSSAELKVIVTSVSGVDGEILYSTEVFNEEDSLRINELIAEYPEFENN